MWEIWVQQIVNGLSAGMAYALVALGLTLTFGVLHVINFAQGELYLLGALGLVVLVELLGIPYPLAVLGGTLFAAAIGWVVDRTAVRDPLEKRGDYSTVLLSTYAISLLIFQLVIWFWGTAPHRVEGIPGVIEIGPITLTRHRVTVLLAGFLLLIAIEWILRRSRFGRELRAVAQNAFAARVVGIDVSSVRSVTFVMSTAIAALAGALLAPITMFSPLMGQAVLIKAFVVVVIGGMGNVSGAVVCGLMLGVLEAVLGRVMTPGLALALIYALLVVALLIRPRGLFGSRY
jgi:branched-chain amino acid transport system permease protein